MLFLTTLNGFKVFKEDYSIEKFKNYAYLPKDVYYVKQERKIEFLDKIYYTTNKKAIKLYEPKIINTQCFDKFPCAPLIDSRFSLRGEDLQDGFINPLK